MVIRTAAIAIEGKLAEQALRENESRFRMLADNMSQLAWTCDLLGNVTWYNKRWLDYTGLTFKDMSGWDWSKVQHPDHLDRVVAGVRRSAANGAMWEDTFPLRGRDGNYRWFLSTAQPIRDEAGQIVRWFGPNTDITDLRNAELALGEANNKLEVRVKERTAELEKRTSEVKLQSEQLRELSVQLMHAQDHERRRISRELHDSLGQYLAHAKMSAESLRRSDAPQKENQSLSHLIETLDHCLTEARTISHLLHPPLLDEIGFPSAARWYADAFSERSGIQTHITISQDLIRLPQAVELALFRILQESLTNIHHYAHSQSAEIQVEMGTGEITLQVRDYGQGIPTEKLEQFRSRGSGGGLGLRSMRERVIELGGQFEVQSDNTGTRIRATVPFHAEHQKPAAEGVR